MKHRKGSNQSSPNPESAALPTPGDSYITNQPSNLFLNKSERERLLPTVTGQVTSCLSLAWLRALTARCEANMITHIIFFWIIDICRTASSNKQLESAGREHLPYRCDWLNRFHNTLEPLLWDTSIQRTPLVGDKIWSKKNFHIIFALKGQFPQQSKIDWPQIKEGWYF